MKKTYSKPQAQAVSLFAEEALLSISGGNGVTVDPNKTADTQFSSEKGWSADSWTATDED